MGRKKIPQTVYIDSEQQQHLAALRERGIPLAELFRQALDVVIATHRTERRTSLSRTYQEAQSTLDADNTTQAERGLAEHAQKAVLYARRMESERDTAIERERALHVELRTIKRTVDAALGYPPAC